MRKASNVINTYDEENHLYKYNEDRIHIECKVNASRVKVVEAKIKINQCRKWLTNDT